MIKCPLGYRVGDRAGEMQGGESVEAFDVAALSHSCYARAVEDAVLLVDFLNRFIAQVFLGSTYATNGLDLRDSFVQVRAGDPEPGRHVSGRLVLYNARQPERTPGSNPERSRVASQLSGYGFMVLGVRGFRHQALGFRGSEATLGPFSTLHSTSVSLRDDS